MITVTYRGRLGNNLFQYAFGRILSKETGQALQAPPINYFKNVINIQGSIIGNAILVSCENFGYNLKNLLNLNNQYGFYLSGFFQNKDYYESYHKEICEWFKVDNYENPHKISSEDIVLHIRRGDYKDIPDSCIALEYYEDILKNTKYDRVFICTDEITSEVFEGFKKYDPIYHKRSEIEDFLFIKSFNKIVMANSTFSWWASFLSEAKEIYFPSPRKETAHFHSKAYNQNLYIDRFIKVSNVETY